MSQGIARWQVGGPGGGELAGVGRVALDVEDAPPGAVLFHDAMRASPGLAREVEVWLPRYRGKSLARLLAWLVSERLASPGARVTWCLDRQQGPDSIARLLADLGWSDLGKDRDGRLVRLSGRPGPHADLPEPARFTSHIGTTSLVFEADYGVFSPQRIDDGTAWLLDVALREAPVPVVADIGIGCGPLAIGLVANGVAGAAIGTDVDCVALWLAGRNAERSGVTLRLACTPEPARVDPTPLTVCNVPTHINAERSRALLAGLTARAGVGRLLAVVHASLEDRYAQHFRKAGLRLELHRGPTHTVLATGQR